MSALFSVQARDAASSSEAKKKLSLAWKMSAAAVVLGLIPITILVVLFATGVVQTGIDDVNTGRFEWKTTTINPLYTDTSIKQGTIKVYVSCSERYKYCTFTSVDENRFTLEITCGSCNYSKFENPTVSEESGFRFCGVRYECKLSFVHHIMYIYSSSTCRCTCISMYKLQVM